MNDLVHRKEAIEAILADKIDAKSFEIMKALGDGLQAETLNMTCNRHAEILKSLPSAEQRWIPVTERLPDKMGTYLVTLDYKEHGTGVMSLWFHNEEIGWDLRVADEVTAWMPLPEPWKGEKDE